MIAHFFKIHLHSYYYSFLGSENDTMDSKVLSATDENCTKEESDMLTKPLECNSPTTDLKETSNSNMSNSQDIIEVKVVYNKKKYDVSAPSNLTIPEFKKQLQGLLGSYYIEIYPS